MRAPRLRFVIGPGAAGLEVGAARDALFSWLLARTSGGAIVLRSDLIADRAGEAERRVIDDLLWLGLGWDEGIEAQGEHGPYRRAHRLELYRSAALDLLRRDLAYRCTCPVPPGLDPGWEPATCACRDAAPMYRPERATGEGPLLFRPSRRGEQGDFVLLYGDGGPGPEFATALDDAMMGITHVVTGPDSETVRARQVLLHAAISPGASPQSIELPPIIAPAGDGTGGDGIAASSVERYRHEGYPPEAVLNLLARLGGATDVGRELLTKEEMLAGFDRGRVSSEARSVEARTLRRLSLHHMARMPPERLAGLAAEHLAAAGLLRQPPSTDERAWAGDVARLFVDGLFRMCDLPAHAALLHDFDPGRSLALEPVRRILGDASSRRVIAKLAGSPDAQAGHEGLTATHFHALVEATRRTTGVKGRPLYDAVRVALTGRVEGPDLAQLIALIDRGSRLTLPRPVIGCRDRARSLLVAAEGEG